MKYQTVSPSKPKFNYFVSNLSNGVHRRQRNGVVFVGAFWPLDFPVQIPVHSGQAIFLSVTFLLLRRTPRCRFCRSWRSATYTSLAHRFSRSRCFRHSKDRRRRTHTHSQTTRCTSFTIFYPPCVQFLPAEAAEIC